MGPRAHGAQGDSLRVERTGPDPSRTDRNDRNDRNDRGEELAERARRGDRAAFEELVRATSAETYALAFRLTGNEHDARDVVQDAYLRAFRSIRKFRGESSFATWLYRITANCSATLHQSRQALRPAPLDTEPALESLPANPDPDALASSAVERDRLVRALDGLAPGPRTVVVLRDVYGLSHEEIAAELGISGAATRVRLHRARRQLRGVLLQAEHDTPGRPARTSGPPVAVPTGRPDRSHLLEAGRGDARAV